MGKLIGVVSVLGAGALGFGVSALTKPSPASPGRPSSNVAAAEISGPERLRIVERVLVQPPEPRATASAEAERPERDQDAPESSTAVAAPTDEERRIYADSVFESESYDATWAPGAAQRVSAAINAASVKGVRLRGTQCKSSLCKVDLVGDDTESAGKSVKPIVRALKWPGSGMAVMGDSDSRGNQSFSLYLARGDTPLPEPPP